MINPLSLAPPPYKQYIQAGLVAIIIAVFVGYRAYLIHKGVVQERDKWKQAVTEQAIEKERRLNEINAKNMELTEKSAAYAQQIEAIYNERNNEIDKLESDNRDLLNNVSVLKRKVFRRDCTSYMPKAGDAVIPANTTTENEFTTEFQEFLLSSFKRGDEAGVYAEIAHEWALDACKSGLFKGCPELKKSP